MRTLPFSFLCSSIFLSFLLLTPSDIRGLAIQLGPFNLELHGGYDLNRKALIDAPLCTAIRNHQRVEMVIEHFDKSTPNEFKSVIKRVVIEPYAFGITRDGTPVIKGNLISERKIKEVFIRYSEDRETTSQKEDVDKTKSNFFSGFWKSKNSIETLNVREVRDINVIQDSSFKTPDKIADLLKDENFRPICEIEPLER